MINNDIYIYINIGFGGFCLLPQILSGYKTRSLRDVSSLSLICIFISSGMFSYSSYVNKEKLISYISGFITLNSIILVCMQFMLYYERFQKHVKTFESKVPAAALSPVSTNLVQVELIKNDDILAADVKHLHNV